MTWLTCRKRLWQNKPLDPDRLPVWHNPMGRKDIDNRQPGSYLLNARQSARMQKSCRITKEHIERARPFDVNRDDFPSPATDICPFMSEDTKNTLIFLIYPSSLLTRR